MKFEFNPEALEEYNRAGFYSRSSSPDWIGSEVGRVCDPLSVRMLNA